MTDRVLVWSQHSVGLGHLSRTLALAAGLAEEFEVVVASGGVLPGIVSVPPGVRVVELDPIGVDGVFALRGGANQDVRATLAGRRRALLDLVGTYQPSVVILELFPFGRRKFNPEVAALVAAARRLRPRPLVVSSVRDILVCGRRGQVEQDRFALTTANSMLDAILVHADPRLASFDESFPHCDQLLSAVHHTGYVVGPRRDEPTGRGDVVVSAGGGRVGRSLFLTAIAAQRDHLAAAGRRMRIIGGPFLPEEDWDEMVALSSTVPALSLVREVGDLRAAIAGARVSVSQCGYNTTLEVLAEGTPSVVVPFVTASEDEQRRRADRLADLGALITVDPQALTPSHLASAIEQAAGRGRHSVRLDLDGARTSTRILTELMGARRSAAA